MSVLETPRLYFRGKATWDPIVTNNDPAQYDEDSSTTVFDSRCQQRRGLPQGCHRRRHQNQLRRPAIHQ